MHTSRAALAFLAVLVSSGAPALRVEAQCQPFGGTCNGQPCCPPNGGPSQFVTAVGAANEGEVHGHLAVADLGLAGGKSVIFGTKAGKLYVIRASDGALATGFPVTLPADLVSSPAIGDLTGDGIPEIVIGYGSAAEPTKAGGFRAYRRDGSLLWQRVTMDFDPYNGTLTDGVPGTAAIGDLDGNGSIEVAIGALDARVYVVEGATGNDRAGWPQFVRDTIFSSPVLHDLDSDGSKEVIIGVDAHLEGAPHNTPDGGCLRVFRANGNAYPGFPVCVDQIMASAPSVGDIDGDGKPEIVIGTGRFWQNRLKRLYAFKCDGTQLAGWPVTTDGYVERSPALADITGDGILDVIATDAVGEQPAPPTTYNVYAFTGAGTQLWKRTPKDYFGVTFSAGDPIVADVVGDANLEILVPTNGEMAVFSNTGTQLSDDGGHQAGKFSFFGTGTMTGAFLDTDGKLYAMTPSPFPSFTSATLNVWQAKVPAAGGRPWPAFRREVARNGLFPGTPACVAGGGPPTVNGITPSCASTTGGRVVTITGSNFVAGATVTLLGTPCTVGTLSATQITCTTTARTPPLTYSGLGNVVVTNPGNQVGTLTNAFSFALRGDANNNGALTGADSFYLNLAVFLGGSPTASLCNGDSNGNGAQTAADSFHLNLYIFLGGSAPPP
ncbi:MAG: VCBS repeat-containing protein [Acidobacteria bacterium]|nr:VCBS repeat-containing protein [Acidobacteriota bacterium]